MNVSPLAPLGDQGSASRAGNFPKLHEMGSDGLYYTQEEMRDVITTRGIAEFACCRNSIWPGHSTACSWATRTGQRKRTVEIERNWGIFDPAMDPTNEKVYKFSRRVDRRDGQVFPDHYFHIGGDEVKRQNGRESERFRRS